MTRTVVFVLYIFSIPTIYYYAANCQTVHLSSSSTTYVNTSNLVLTNWTFDTETPGYGERCFLHSVSIACSNDVSCIWCVKESVGRCLAKNYVVQNSTLVVDSCLSSYFSVSNGTCDSIVCDECSGTNCLARRCGVPDGTITVSNSPITRESCNPINTPCYWCSTGKDTGSCQIKTTDCVAIQNRVFGVCISVDCVTGDQYDGNLLIPYERDVVMGVRMFSSLVSLLATAFMMFTIIFFQKYKYLSNRLIFSLIICNFVVSCANLMSLRVYNHEVELFEQCYAQGTLLQFGEVSTFLWVFAITLNLYLIVVFNIQKKFFEFIYHFFIWTFGLAAALIPWSSKAYGIAGLWCWIRWDYQIFRWLLYYLPLILVIISVILLYSLIYTSVLAKLKAQKKQPNKDAQALLSKLKIYPIVFFIIYAFSMINRIYDWASPDDSFPLYVAESLLTPLFGFVNSVIYLFDVDTRASWRKQLFEMGCCISCTAPTHQEFEDEDNTKENEINFDVPDESKTQPQQNLF